MALPIIKRELIAVLRTRRAFWLLVSTVAVSGLLPLANWPSPGQAYVYAHQNAEIFATFAMTQLSIGLLIIPAFTVGAISGEREHGTYELLYTTLLSPFAIVFSKFLASAGFVIILLLASAPSVCVLYLLGGIGFSTVLEVYGVTFLSITLSTLVCLTASMRSQRTAHAAVRGVLWVLLWNGGLALLAMLVWACLAALDILDWRSGEIAGVVLSVIPYTVIAVTVFGESGFAPPWAMWTSYLVFSGLACALHGAYLVRAMALPDAVPRRARRAATSGRRVVPRAWRPRRTFFTRLLIHLGESDVPLLSNPVFLKEIRSEFFGRVWFRRVTFWLCLAIFAVFGLFDDDIELVFGPASIISLVLICLFIPAITASALPREIEQGNLDLLRGTAIPLWSVCVGKMLAGAYAIAGILAAGFWVCLLRPLYNVWWGGETFDSLFGRHLVCAVVLGGTTVFLLGLAMLFSSIAKKSLGALLGAMFTVAALYILVPVLWAASGIRLDYDDSALIAGTNPFYVLLDGLFDGSRDSVFDLPFANLGCFLLIHAGGGAMLAFAAVVLVERLRERDR